MKSCNNTPITLLSFGGGQDSTCILYKIINDPIFRAKWVDGDLIVVMANTGNEHPHTYRHIRYVRRLCREHGIPFHFLTSKMGYHPRTWKSLTHQFRLNNTVMSVAFPRSCSDNLKIKPIYNFLDHYIATNRYGYDIQTPPRGKTYIKRFHVEGGRIRTLIGIAAGEESRIASHQSKQLYATQLQLFKKTANPYTSWMNRCIDKQYPLVDERIDRQAAQDYIRSTGLNLPYPSNCMMCPFISKIELLWLYRNYPEVYQEWKAYERKKIEKNAGQAIRNLGVKGEHLLDEVLRQAIEEFGHLTEAQLDEYKMSHGHCVKSKF